MSEPVVAIIEDDRATREFLVECLTVEGYRALPYHQGAGAYELIENARPDAVILDIRMEHPQAGLAVLQRLRRDPELATTPVIVCTADAPFTQAWSRTLAEQRCTVVIKPFDIGEFVATLRELIATPPEEAPRPPRAGAAMPPAIRPVIALVDSDGHGVTTHTEQLERKGYKVVGCRWGNGLYDMAVREQPDLLIVEVDAARRWHLARIVRRLRHDPLTSAIPLVVNPRRDHDFYRTIEERLGPAPPPLPATQRVQLRFR